MLASALNASLLVLLVISACGKKDAPAFYTRQNFHYQKWVMDCTATPDGKFETRIADTTISNVTNDNKPQLEFFQTTYADSTCQKKIKTVEINGDYETLKVDNADGSIPLDVRVYSVLVTLHQDTLVDEYNTKDYASISWSKEQSRDVTGKKLGDIQYAARNEMIYTVTKIDNADAPEFRFYLGLTSLDFGGNFPSDASKRQELNTAAVYHKEK